MIFPSARMRASKQVAEIFFYGISLLFSSFVTHVKILRPLTLLYAGMIASKNIRFSSKRFREDCQTLMESRSTRIRANGREI